MGLRPIVSVVYTDTLQTTFLIAAVILGKLNFSAEGKNRTELYDLA